MLNSDNVGGLPLSRSIMPYKIENRGGAKPFKIINKNTGKVVGSSTSRAEAQTSVNARLAGAHGWKGTKGK